jgi:hypothetical protein
MIQWGNSKSVQNYHIPITRLLFYGKRTRITGQCAIKFGCNWFLARRRRILLLSFTYGSPFLQYFEKASILSDVQPHFVRESFLIPTFHFVHFIGVWNLATSIQPKSNLIQGLWPVTSLGTISKSTGGRKKKCRVTFYRNIHTRTKISQQESPPVGTSNFFIKWAKISTPPRALLGLVFSEIQELHNFSTARKKILTPCIK